MWVGLDSLTSQALTLKPKLKPDLSLDSNCCTPDEDDETASDDDDMAKSVATTATTTVVDRRREVPTMR